MLKRLLSHGFFPHEIPQPFTSRSFGRAISASQNLPEGLKPKKATSAQVTIAAEHNLARVGQLRRTLGIVNPISYCNLAKEISAAWQDLESHCGQSPISATTPVYQSAGPRAITGKMGPPHRTQLRVANRARGRYVLLADIQQFYPSVYTHSLAWALHTKATAKQKKTTLSLLGNRLDVLQNRCQDRQTTGIPIGPDTSLVLAELLLTAVDRILESEINTANSFRLIDDYELVFETYAQAEEALSVLQSTLSSFNLRLNESKTAITDLPTRITSSWTRELRKFSLTEHRLDLHDFFDLAFDFARVYPTEPVLRYALGRARRETVSEKNWNDYEALLCQCALNEPGVLKYVLAEFRKYSDGPFPNLDLIEETIERLVLKHGPVGHGSEVAWSLWMACALNARISEKAADVISKSDDPLVPLVALDARQRGLFKAELDTSKWQNMMSADELLGPNWLLVYEAKVQGWLPSIGTKDHIKANTTFAFLESKNVHFYNKRASSLKVPRWSDIIAPADPAESEQGGADFWEFYGMGPDEYNEDMHADSEF